MPVVPSSSPAPLASPAEMQALMPGVELDVDQVDLLIAIASDTIRSETGQTLSLVIGDVLELRGTFVREFWLPERPTLAVTSIHIDGQLIPATAYRASRDGRVTFSRWPWTTAVNGPDAVLGGSWGGDERFLSVVTDHGYDPIPADIKGVCLDLVRAGIVAPDAGIIRQESLGSYNVSYSAERAGALTKAHERTLRRYRRQNATVVPVP
jgi:hypothetical protein